MQTLRHIQAHTRHTPRPVTARPASGVSFPVDRPMGFSRNELRRLVAEMIG